MDRITDIAEGQWYTDAVNWAAEQGVVNGYPSVFFAYPIAFNPPPQYLQVFPSACVAGKTLIFPHAKH